MSICRLSATIVALQLFCYLGSNTLFAQQGTRPPFGGQPGTQPFGQPAGQPGGQPGGPTGAPGGYPAGMPAAGGAPSSARPASSESSVVVIDVSEVFKKHERFKMSMDEIKEEMKKLESLMQVEQKELMKKQERLREMNPGSPDFKKLEEDLARSGSDFQVSMQLKQKEIIEKEAKIYYGTYMEVLDLVKEFAERNGIRLVLRFHRAEMDPTKRDTVLQGVNRPIVYQRNLDITDFIVSQCNKGMPTKTDAAGRPAIPRR